MKKHIHPAFLVFLGAFIVWATLANSGMLEVLDRSGLLMFRTDDTSVTVGPAWLPAVMKGFSHVGGTVALIGLSLLTVAAAWHMAGRTLALQYVGMIGGGMLLVSVLKKLFGRARPDLVERLVHETSLSFPSGHATRSMIVYLAVALFLVTVRRQKAGPVFFAAGLLAGGVGISRVFLGVHWPSDIIGGWLLAFAWLSLWAPYLKPDVRKA